MFGPQRHENLAAALPVPPGGTVLEIGCGRGSTQVALDRRGELVYSINDYAVLLRKR